MKLENVSQYNFYRLEIKSLYDFLRLKLEN